MNEVIGVQKAEKSALLREHDEHITIDLGGFSTCVVGPEQARHLAAGLYSLADKIDARRASKGPGT